MSDAPKSDVALPTAPDADAPKKQYNASCHCGAFTYTVTASPPLDDPKTEVMQCNCSICTRNGYLFIYTPNAAISFTKGEFADLKEYRFGPKPKVAHYFCGTCGSSCVARSIDPNFFVGMTCVNVRMFEDIDLKALKFKEADGKNYKGGE